MENNDVVKTNAKPTFLSGLKSSALQYGANVGGSLIGSNVAKEIGANETVSNAIGSASGLGASLLATKIITGSFGGPIGIGISAGLSALPFVISMFNNNDKKQEPDVKPDNKLSLNPNLKNEILNKNPNATSESVDVELNLIDQMINKTKSDYDKALAPINALANGYVNPINPRGIDFNRVDKQIRSLGETALSYSAGKALGALYVQAGLQGGLDMVEKNAMLSADTFGKMKQLVNAATSAKAGNNEAAGNVRQILGDLEAIGLKNRDVISAIGMAADMNIKLANQLNDLAIVKQKMTMKTGNGDSNTRASANNQARILQDYVQSERNSLDRKLKDGLIDQSTYDKSISAIMQNASKALSTNDYSFLFKASSTGPKTIGSNSVMNQQLANIKD